MLLVTQVVGGVFQGYILRVVFSDVRQKFVQEVHSRLILQLNLAGKTHADRIGDRFDFVNRKRGLFRKFVQKKVDHGFFDLKNDRIRSLIAYTVVKSRDIIGRKRADTRFRLIVFIERMNVIGQDQGMLPRVQNELLFFVIHRNAAFQHVDKFHVRMKVRRVVNVVEIPDRIVRFILGRKICLIEGHTTPPAIRITFAHYTIKIDHRQ